MESINKAYGQLVDLFRSMTAGARITAGLLLAAIVVSVFYLFQFDGSRADDYFLNGREFSQEEIGSILAAFAQAELNDAQVLGYKIKIPRAKGSEYLKAASEKGVLPSGFKDPMKDILANSSPFNVSSRHLIDLRVKHQRERTLAGNIRKMPGIEYANVRYDETIVSRLPRTVKAKASVQVRTRVEKPLNSDLVNSIRKSVAGEYAALEDNNVTVTDLTSGRTFPGNGGPNGDNQYLDKKTMYEDQWRENIYSAISMYPGCVVQVNVDLDPKINEQRQETTLSQPVALKSQETSVNEVTRLPERGGRPGTDPNLSNTPRTVDDGPASTRKEVVANTESVAGQTTTTSQTASWVPKNVNATIGVPKDVFRRIWEKQNPTPAGETPADPDPGKLQEIEQTVITNIEKTVNQILPQMAGGQNPFPRVAVHTFETLDPGEIPQPTLTDNALTWLGNNWQALGMMLMGGVSLLLLRSMVNSATTPLPTESDDTEGSSSRSDSQSGEDENEETSVNNLLRNRFQSSGPNLRQELVDVVREDPDAAANVLRSWIDNAA